MKEVAGIPHPPPAAVAPLDSGANSRPRDYTIGVVGLGRMGSGMATHLAESGFRVIGYDIDPARSAGGPYEWTDDLSRLRAECSFVILSLPHAADLSTTLEHLGAPRDPRGDSLCIIDTGTSLPEVQVPAAKRLAAQGDLFVDAPVSGGPAGARNGTLLVMVGGDAEAVNRARPVLNALAGKVVHLGEVGNGTRAKLLNNGLVAVSLFTVARAFRFARAQGISDRDLADVLSSGSARGNVVDNIVGARIRGESSDVRFAFEHLLKDISYLNAELTRHSETADLIEVVERSMESAVKAGNGGSDFGDISAWLAGESSK